MARKKYKNTSGEYELKKTSDPLGPEDAVWLIIPPGATKKGALFAATDYMSAKRFCREFNKALELGRKAYKAEVRDALRAYVRSEGCSCCEDTSSHDEAAERLAKLLDVPAYPDGSGYDFYSFGEKREV